MLSIFTIITPGEVDAARTEYHGRGQYAVANGGPGPDHDMPKFRARHPESVLHGYDLEAIVAELQVRFAGRG